MANCNQQTANRLPCCTTDFRAILFHLLVLRPDRLHNAPHLPLLVFVQLLLELLDVIFSVERSIPPRMAYFADALCYFDGDHSELGVVHGLGHITIAGAEGINNILHAMVWEKKTRRGLRDGYG
jgi:hypothetical protein